MKIPFLDLKRQYLPIKEEIDEAIQRVVSSQNFILGEEVQTFEENLAKYCGAKHAIGVASGTDAILLSLKGHKISNNVITSPYTFFATAGAIYNARAKPQFIDINPNSFNMDPEKLREEVQKNKKISSIIPVHLYGQPAEMNPIMEVAEDHDLIVIEDAAQAIGSQYYDKKVGSMNTTCFSFFPAKNLGCYGDGGVITTNDDEIAETIYGLRVHGSKRKYYHYEIGYNSRLDAIQAAILNVKLKYIDKWNDMRNSNAIFYNKALINIEGLKLPDIHSNLKHVFNQYTLRVKDGLRDDLKEFLTKKGIGTAIYYPLPLHLQPCFSYLKYQEGSFPNAELASQEVLSIPIYPEIRKQELEFITESIIDFFENLHN
jgi:dTDP-4-amino-4,6-dideoxygalactose transaminase